MRWGESYERSFTLYMLWPGFWPLQASVLLKLLNESSWFSTLWLSHGVSFWSLVPKFELSRFSRFFTMAGRPSQARVFHSRQWSNYNILCRVGRKTLTQSTLYNKSKRWSWASLFVTLSTVIGGQFIEPCGFSGSLSLLFFSVCIMQCCFIVQNKLMMM